MTGISSASFGDLRGYADDYNDTSMAQAGKDHDDGSFPKITVWSGTEADLQKYVESFNKTMQQINSLGVSYDPVFDNSNTFVHQLLSEACLPIALPAVNGNPIWAPGYNRFVQKDRSESFSEARADFNYERLLETSGTLNMLSFAASFRLPSGAMRAANACKVGARASDPIVVGLGAGGIGLTQLSGSSPFYDFDGTGLGHATAWTKNGTGFLVELSPSGLVRHFTSGFSQLAQIDANGDNVVDASDSGFETLRIWQDVNDNGKIDSGELQSLSSLDIQSINLSYTVANQDINGNTITALGSVTMGDGTTREMADVNLQTSTVYTQFESLPSVSSNIATLPQLHGYGQMMDLQSSMSLDPTLVTVVQSFIVSEPSMSFTELQSSVADIMYRWAGIDGTDPASRGYAVDARQLAFLEKYLGQTMTFPDEAPGLPINDPQWFPGMFVDQAWNYAENGILARLLIQTDPQIGAEFSFDATEDAVNPTETLSSSLAGLLSEYSALNNQTLDAWKKVAIILDTFRSELSFNVATFASAVSQSNIPGLDIVQDAVAQGLPVSIDADGKITVSQLPNTMQQTGGYSYVFSAGDGVEEISYSALQYLTHQIGYKPNKLYLTGIDPASANWTIDASGDLVITDDIAGDEVVIDGQTASNLAPPSQYVANTDTQYVECGVQSISFDDGTVWGPGGTFASEGQSVLASPFAGQIYDPFGLTGSIVAHGGDNTFIMAADYGHVTVQSSCGNDTIWISGGLTPADVSLQVDDATGDLTVRLSHDDTMTLKADASMQNGQSVSDVATLKFDSGYTEQVWLPALTFDYYGVDASTLVGTSLGLNVYHLSAGDGAVTVVPGRTNILAFASGVTMQMLDIVTDSAGDLTFRVHGTADSITVANALWTESSGVLSSIAGLRFADGGWVRISDGTGSPNLLNFSPVDVAGGATVTGSVFGNDTFRFGAGGGTAIAGPYYSSFLYGRGDGASIIDVGSTLSGYTASLTLDEGITGSDLVFRTNIAGDLIIGIKDDPQDTVTIKNDLAVWWNGVHSVIPYISLADGSLVSLSQNITFTTAVSGGNTITGTQFGDNEFDFGPGGGTVVAGHTNNVFNYALGDGAAVIDLSQILDGFQACLKLAPGITAADLLYQVNETGDVTIGFSGHPDDSVTIKGDLTFGWWGGAKSLAWVLLADGTGINLAGGLTFQQPVAAGATVTGTVFGSSNFLFQPGGGTAVGGQHSNAFDFAAGGDTAVAGTMDNTYHWGLGDGNTTIRYDAMNPYTQRLILGTGITASDVTLSSDAAGDLVIGVRGNTDDTLTISGDFHYNNYYGSWQSEVSSIELADGTSVSVGNSTFTRTVSGGATVTGFDWAANSFVFGEGGGTAVIGLSQNYVTYGLGGGHATLQFGPNNAYAATVSFGPGITSDQLVYSANAAGDLTIGIRGDAEDTLTIKGNLSWGYYGGVNSIIPWIRMSDGSYVYLNSLTYAETVSGGETVTGTRWGNNEFTFGSGGGTAITGPWQNTVVFEQGSGHATVEFGPNNGWTPTIYFGAGITSDQPVYSANAAGDLTIGIRGDSDDTLTLKGELFWNNYGGIGTVVPWVRMADGNYVYLNQVVFTNVVSSGSTVTGSSFGGNDFQFAPGGGTAVGGQFANWFEFAPGGDTAVAGPQYNTFGYHLGDGAVTVQYASPATWTQPVYFGPGISSQDIIFAANSEGDLSFRFRGSPDDSFTMKGVLDVHADGSVSSAVPWVHIDDGEFISIGQNTTFTHSVTGGATETGTGLGGNDFQFGTGGGTAVGGPFANWYEFAPGGDTAVAGPQYNTFGYHLGDGAVTVTYPTAPSWLQPTYFGPGITASDLVFSSPAAGDLKVGIKNHPDDAITFQGVLSGQGNGMHSGISWIHMDDGQYVYIDQNTLFTQDVSDGGTVIASSNNTVFQFGAGGGTAVAGAGNNVFEYGQGDGAAVITPASLGILKLSEGLNAQHLWFSQSGQDLVISALDGQDDVVTVSGWFGNQGGLSEITGGDGLVLDVTGIGNLVSVMATYQQATSGLSVSSLTALPTDQTLQAAIAAAWHT